VALLLHNAVDRHSGLVALLLQLTDTVDSWLYCCSRRTEWTRDSTAAVDRHSGLVALLLHNAVDRHSGLVALLLQLTDTVDSWLYCCSCSTIVSTAQTAPAKREYKPHHCLQDIFLLIGRVIHKKTSSTSTTYNINLLTNK